MPRLPRVDKSGVPCEEHWPEGWPAGCLPGETILGCEHGRYLCPEPEASAPEPESKPEE